MKIVNGLNVVGDLVASFHNPIWSSLFIGLVLIRVRIPGEKGQGVTVRDHEGHRGETGDPTEHLICTYRVKSRSDFENVKKPRQNSF